jgi:hypothetical protein
MARSRSTTRRSTARRSTTRRSAAQGSTVQEIVADATAAENELGVLERKLQDEIDAIRRTAFLEDRALTDAEIERRKELLATQGEVREAVKVLAFMTVQRLSKSEDVKNLLHQMEMVNAGLQDDLAKLEKVKKVAETAAKVADTLAKAGEKLAKFAAEGIPIPGLG